jgi:hypothetical protein
MGARHRQPWRKPDGSVSFSSGPISDHDEEERKTPHTTVGEHGKEVVVEIL